ncbi:MULTISPECIES: nucleotidyltransferase domain-containing protein [Enterococcus]|uniref:nucleotidyltransferase domain-containing protein n=1 Tax=Enterococcus TaxID=1350 RepID=UPI0010FA0A80|nr:MULTISPECIES: aminoglycoside adenylyltransferase [Enterococcus]KAF1301736.1 hypothetical protein BAU16_07540 [Enterococcus sp. JM9B]
MKKKIVSKIELFKILDFLDGLAIHYWVDGGWGVDILTGKQNREHRDIDIDFDSKDTDRLLTALYELGYEKIVDWMPARMELWHENLGYLDIHPLEINPDGSAKQADLEDGFYFFQADWFTKKKFENREIPCLSLEAQLIFHKGYELRESDYIDLKNLEKLAGHNY